MAASEVAICNRALLRIGVTDTIEALTDQTTEAGACDTLYSQTRDELLASFEWPFATKRATLALLADVERTEWAYAYALPTDLLAAREIASGLRRLRADQTVPYAIEFDADTNARVLFTDQADAELVYTAQVTSPLLFPAAFTDALAWALAADLAMALSVKEGMSERARQHADMARDRAMAEAFNETRRDPRPLSKFISVREYAEDDECP